VQEEIQQRRNPLRVDTDFDALLPKDVTQKVSAANEQM